MKVSAGRTPQQSTLHRRCPAKNKNLHAGLHARAHCTDAVLLRTKICVQDFTDEHTAQMLSELPTRWEKLGDLALLPRTCLASPDWAHLGQPLWRAIADALGVARLAMQAPVANTGRQSACVVPLQPSSC